MPKMTTRRGNARKIHEYLVFLQQSQGRATVTICHVADTLGNFEKFAGGKDFRLFKPDWAISFKQQLAIEKSQRTNGKLSIATVNTRLRQLKCFFVWLCEQPGYRSRINRTDASYFNPTLRDQWAEISRARRTAPTPEQVLYVVQRMPVENDQQLRNRALIAFIILTGARADAAASFILGNLNLTRKTAFFDGRSMRTKNRKGYTADFFPVHKSFVEIVSDWSNHLRSDLFFGNKDPLFPATKLRRSSIALFETNGLTREFWKSSEPVRRVFTEACEAAGIPYFNPHSLRTTLALLGEELCSGPEEFKAWSQNMGHENVSTTLRYYGQLSDHRQAELMERLRKNAG